MISPLEWSATTRIDVVEPDGDAAACVERAEDLAATFDAYTAAETPWRLAAALDTAGPRPADPVEFAVLVRRRRAAAAAARQRLRRAAVFTGSARRRVAARDRGARPATRAGGAPGRRRHGFWGAAAPAGVRPRGPSSRSALVCLTKVRIAMPRLCE